MCISQGARVETPLGAGTVTDLDAFVNDYGQHFPDGADEFREYALANQEAYGEDVYVRLDTPVEIPFELAMYATLLGMEDIPQPNVLSFNPDALIVLDGTVPAAQ